MRGLNFLVLRFSILPLVSGVYKFQVLVSFPSLHLRILTRGLHQQGVVGGSSESSFVFNVPVWLIDHVPKNDLKMLTNFKYPTECTDFRRFSQYIPFLAPGFIMGGPGIFVGKNASKCQKKVQFGSLFLLEGLNDVALRWANFSRGYFLCPVFCEKCPLKYLFFA